MGMSLFDRASMAATILRVRDVDASVDWYRDKLGVEPLHVGADGPEHLWAAFSLAGAIVTLWQLPAGVVRQREDNDRNGYVCFVVDDDLEPLRERLAGRGVSIGEVRRSVNNEFVWFYDPDGNRFELSRPVSPQGRALASEAEQMTST